MGQSIDANHWEGIANIQRRYHTFCRQKANHRPPFIPGADRQWSYPVKQSATPQRLRIGVARSMAVLPATHQSVLYTSAVDKLWKWKLQKFLYFFDLPSFFVRGLGQKS
ncbi:hypothetical protein TNCV_4363901 [Trichonephila clavipes]|nr:hypothetical protein TNCV_4363901 [Trichonephila clavipes]